MMKIIIFLAGKQKNLKTTKLTLVAKQFNHILQKHLPGSFLARLCLVSVGIPLWYFKKFRECQIKRKCQLNSF